MAQTLRRFGWCKPSADGTLNFGIRKTPLTEEAWEEFGEIIQTAADVRPYVIDFLAMEEEHKFLVSAATEVPNSSPIRGDDWGLTGVRGIYDHVQIQRPLTAYLSACSAFRDRANQTIMDKHGKGCDFQKFFKEQLSHVYDNSFAYRLFYHLRNYAQHHANPVSTINLRGKRDSVDEAMEFVVNLVLEPKKLLQNKEFKRKLGKELEQRSGEPLKVLLLAQKNQYCHEFILRRLLEKYLPRLLEMQRYAQMIISKSGLPKGATPIIWEGDSPPENLDNANMRFHHFSFDELGFLNLLFQRLATRLD